MKTYDNIISEGLFGNKLKEGYVVKVKKNEHNYSIHVNDLGIVESITGEKARVAWDYVTYSMEEFSNLKVVETEKPKVELGTKTTKGTVWAYLGKNIYEVKNGSNYDTYSEKELTSLKEKFSNFI